jgi:hypothetical protein
MAPSDEKSQEPRKPKAYTKDEQAKAMRKMFEELARMRGGNLILGCCTQGCCE